jgi:2-dehydropantoate 2-reductase
MGNAIGSSIAVVGAGAIGSYFGGLLARAGRKVTLIGRQRHVDAINRDGLLFQSGGVEERIPITATADIAAMADARLILFCVKSLDTEEAAARIAPHLAPDAVILSLQNGVDNRERIRLHVKNHVIPVLVYAGANIPAPGSVTHTGGGDLIVGQSRESRGNEADRRRLGEIAALFAGAGVRVKISDDIDADLWTKLVMNCAYNAICALSGAPYGQMVAMPEIRGVMTEAVNEVVEVAKGKGVRLPGDIVESAMRLADAMPRTTSSTAQDLAKGRTTEIDHLNGYVVRQGEALGIPTPVNRTLSALMKLAEQTKRISLESRRP